MDGTKHYWLYVLKLTSNKYYVGITSKTPEIRFKEHSQGFNAAAWTRKYKPVSIHYQKDLGRILESKAESYENKVVRRYINKYGIENVRGGDIRLSEDLVIRSGRWWLKKDWEALSTALFLTLCLLVLAMLYILQK